MSKNISSAFIFLLSIFVSSTNGANRADFLIVSNPGELSILNHFEQTISSSEKEHIFIPYSPLRIIDRNTTLGDQITEALKFIYNEDTWYIQKNDKGNFSGALQKYQKTFLNCEIIDDTVGLTKSIRLYEKYPSSGNSFIIDKPSSVKRVFKYQKGYYLYSFDLPGKYGWYNGPSSVFLVKKTAQKSNQIQDNLILRIQTRIQSVNEKYHGLFKHFNEITNQQKSIPEWIIEEDKDIIKCRLNGSSEIINQLEQSTQYVVQDIKQLLLGKPFAVEYQNGLITIRAQR